MRAKEIDQTGFLGGKGGGGEPHQKTSLLGKNSGSQKGKGTMMITARSKISEKTLSEKEERGRHSKKF